MSFNLDTCRSKDELEQFAKNMFDVDLDKRKKLDELKGEVRELIAASLDNKETGTVEPEPENEPAPAETTAKQEAVFVKHKKTGAVFHYQPQLKKRVGVDLIPCDKDGKAV